jgi:hypothetical protein
MEQGKTDNTDYSNAFPSSQVNIWKIGNAVVVEPD